MMVPSSRRPVSPPDDRSVDEPAQRLATSEGLPWAPLTIILLVVALSQALLALAAAVAQRPILPLAYHSFGFDFKDFWIAAQDVLAGADPYARPRFVTPPLSWLPFLPFAALERSTAALLFAGVNLAALGGGVALLARRLRLNRQCCIELGLIVALAPTTLMLIERGNLDGLVFAALAVFLVARRAGPAAMALAVATALKLYPAVFWLAMVAFRQFRPALVVAALIATTVALLPGEHLAFIHNQIGRANGMRLDENLSGLAVFWVLGQLGGWTGAQAQSALGLGALLYAAALAVCLWIDHDLAPRLDAANRRLLLASYVVFCVNMPALVYLYSGVCLLLLAAALAQDGLLIAPATRSGWAMALGATMAPAKAAALTFAGSGAEALNLLPPCASLFLMAYAVSMRVELRKMYRTQPAGAPTPPLLAAAE